MKTTVRFITAAALLLAVSMTQADPLPDEILKFEQLPLDGLMIGNDVYFGHDELSTAYGDHNLGEYGNMYGPGTFMADDFADSVRLPVVHVQWWGSYMQDSQPGAHVKKFLISFESDIPADATGSFSRPGDPLLTQVVELDASGSLLPYSGTFTEMPVSPGGPPLNEELFVYNAELEIPFDQEPDTVYWLKIVALVDPIQDGPIQWGWHNRDYSIFNPTASGAVSTPPFGEHLAGHITDPDGTEEVEVWHFQDNAVSGNIIDIFIDPAGGQGVNMFQDPDTFSPQYYIGTMGGLPMLEPGVDGPDSISEFSKDLAFALYAPIPEPSSFVLLGMACVCLLLLRRRNHQ